jgi:hypothetical protein
VIALVVAVQVVVVAAVAVQVAIVVEVIRIIHVVNIITTIIIMMIIDIPIFCYRFYYYVIVDIITVNYTREDLNPHPVGVLHTNL